MAAVHQFVAGFTHGDAISNEAVAIRAILRKWGLASDIFSEPKRILPELRKEARDAMAYGETCSPDDTVILHLSIGSPLNEIFPSLPCRKIILYHNVTPSRYWQHVNLQTADLLARGDKQVRRLAGVAELVLADSAFNAQELTDAGYGDVSVLPLILDFDRFDAPPDRGVLKACGDGRKNVIFVGRCAPNKKIEDAITAFFHLHSFVDPETRFIHVGSFAGAEPYYHLLRARIRTLGLENVIFAGSVRLEQLNAFYRSADLFLCMSEHEGFCIPLLEAMHFDVPVMAYAAGAVPETLDGAGVLVRDKQYGPIAEMMSRMLRDDALRQGIIARQRERIEAYRKLDLEDELRRHLAPFLETTNG